VHRTLKDDAACLKALGHPTRLGIALRLAEDGGSCACNFADIFHVSQPTISQHLKVLRDAGLVTTTRHGTEIHYSLAPDAMNELSRLVASLIPPAVRLAS
jgi:ArsR family transcriptional regulator